MHFPAGLFELAMSWDDPFACRMKGASVENKIRRGDMS